jgi:hypothetical protein
VSGNIMVDVLVIMKAVSDILDISGINKIFATLLQDGSGTVIKE